MTTEPQSSEMQKKRLNVQFSTTCKREQGQKTAACLLRSPFLICAASRLHNRPAAWCIKQLSSSMVKQAAR